MKHSVYPFQQGGRRHVSFNKENNAKYFPLEKGWEHPRRESMEFESVIVVLEISKPESICAIAWIASFHLDS
jgi:hypothetical protein